MGDESIVEASETPEVNEPGNLESNQDPSADYYWDETSKSWVLKDGILNNENGKYMYDGSTYFYIDEKSGTKYKWNNDKKCWLAETKEDKKRKNEDDTESECDSSDEDIKRPIHTSTHQIEPISTASQNRVWDDSLKTYVYPDDDGTLYYWDYEKQGWIPKVDEDFIANYQMNYGFIDNTSENDKQEAKPNELPSKPTKNLPSQPGWFEIDAAHNNKVYVSGLPEDINDDDFVELMSKCGLVLKDASTNKYKIKLYKDSNGYMKGDGLCSYIKVESVELALTILDGYQYKGNQLHVERAQFSLKGDYNPSLKPRKKRKRDKEKQMKMQQKLFDWRPDKMRGERNSFERVVVITNMFDVDEFKSSPELILQLREDLQEECSKCGTVKKVIVYDANPKGVAQVFFSSPEEADVCIKLMKGRWFGGRQLEADTWDGKTKYKMQETAEEESARLSEWANHLLN